MKIFCAVDGIDSIPTKFRNDVIVVTQLNWPETYHYLEGKKSLVRLFVHPECPVDRLLKVVEDYQGSLVVYSAAYPNDTFLSRFTRVMTKKNVKIKSFPTVGDKEALVNRIKKLVGV